MKRLFISFLMFVFLISLTHLAVAQGLQRELGDNTDNTVYQKETNYDFDDDVVLGELVKPEGAVVSGEVHGKTSSLIEIRSDFINEMLKSVEDL